MESYAGEDGDSPLNGNRDEDPVHLMMMKRLLASVKGEGDNGRPSEYSARLPPSAYTRQAFINSFNDAVSSDKKKRDNPNTHQSRFSMVPSIEHGVAPSLEALQPISLREVAMRVNYIHHDRVLYVTVVHGPFRIIGTSLLIEDDQGDCVMGVLYNFVKHNENPADSFPVGTHLAILAPYMRNPRDDKTLGLLIRCDNPQCIVVFDSRAAWRAAKEGREPPVEQGHPPDLRKKGNESFQRGNTNAAIIFYSRALRHPSVCLDDEQACLSNRAMAYLRKEQWEDAERDCRMVLEKQHDHVKARFRLAMALLRLSQAFEAHAIAKTLFVEHPKDRAFQELLKDSERLLREEQGQYDIKAMLRENSPNLTTTFHADFVSSDVAIGVDVPRPKIGKYRGCIATTNISEGSVVCASKALSFIPSSELSDMTMQSNAWSNQIEDSSGIALVNEIVCLLHRRPMLGKELYQLSSDEEYVDHTDLEKIYVRRICGIKTSNTFANESDEVTGNWNKMKEEAQRSQFFTEAELQLRASVHKVTRGCGLWIKESMFNHSCTPNCSWLLVGDHMFMRTTRPVAENEELCVTYVGDLSYQHVVESFKDWVKPGTGFTCACDLCDLLRSNKMLRDMVSEVESAYAAAGKLVTFQMIPMAVAAQRVLPEERRQTIIAAFQHLPLRLQHNTVLNLELMQGVVLAARGDNLGAFKCYKRAAEISYSVRGATYVHCKDLWRVVGSAMRLGLRDQAMQCLENIRNTNCFMSLDPSEVREAFMDLTLRYAGPWWLDRMDYSVQQKLLSMASSVWDGKSSSASTTRHRKTKNPKKKR